MDDVVQVGEDSGGADENGKKSTEKGSKPADNFQSKQDMSRWPSDSQSYNNNTYNDIYNDIRNFQRITNFKQNKKSNI